MGDFGLALLQCKVARAFEYHQLRRRRRVVSARERGEGGLCLGDGDECVILSVDDEDRDARLREAAQRLNEAGITGAPVVVDGRLVGVLTAFDFLYREVGALGSSGPTPAQLFDSGKWEASVKKSMAGTVAGAMSKPTAVSPNSDIAQVAALMLSKRFNHVPVVDEKGMIVGILTSQDVLRHVLGRLPA